MARNRYSPTRRIRPGMVIAVLLLHIAALLGLARAFAPAFVEQVVERAASTLTVTVTTPASPPPTPEPAPDPSPSPQQEGAAALPGKMARPREAAAPPAKIVLAPTPAPPVASSGTENRSGAAVSGEGTGAGGEGQGTGAGGSGSGQGGGGRGGGSDAVKIAGDISSARDYPRETRDLRLGHRVVLALTVGTDGRVRSCRIHRASPDPEADRITCRLATERFRFRPATNAEGIAVESVYGWEQRWFNPGGE